MPSYTPNTTCNAWGSKDVSLDAAEDCGSTRRACSDDFVAYTNRRAIEDEIATALYWNSTVCAKTHASPDISDVTGSFKTNINPPQCFALSPEILAWERKEQQFSQRRIANVGEAAADKFLSSPALGWSDVAAVCGDALSNECGKSDPKYVSKLAPQCFAADKRALDSNMLTNAVPVAATTNAERAYADATTCARAEGLRTRGLRPGSRLR